jgi:hypothetical protein
MSACDVRPFSRAEPCRLARVKKAKVAGNARFGRKAGGRMMPGAAYATPHSTERDGHLHSVASVARPKERFDFFRTVA